MTSPSEEKQSTVEVWFRGKRIGGLLIAWPVNLKGCALLLAIPISLFAWVIFSAIIGLMQSYPFVVMIPICISVVTAVLVIGKHTEVR